MFVKITNGQVEKFPYSIGEFRKANPNKSFPKDIPTSILEDAGVFVIKETQPPTVDKKTHTYSWDVELKDGAWTQVWSTKQLDQSVAEKNVRDHRDRLLAETDWMVIKHLELNQNIPGIWEVYRQDLRDIPWEVTWPEKP
jgi:hypothetical protein